MREPLPNDGKSGALLERVEIDGQRYVLKHIDLRQDWIMRQSGDLRGYPITVWTSGVLDLVPDVIDHAYVGAARDEHAGAVLMRDVSDFLVAQTDAPVTLDQHTRFLSHLAAFHASTWGWSDTLGLTPLGTRMCWFGPAALACEMARDDPADVPRIATSGWEQLRDVAPRVATVLAPLRIEPWALVDALRAGPQTFIHGDWKLANLGSMPDGRTILLDWALPGAGPPLLELAHYLALNSARLPVGHTKDDAIATYRDALGREGVETSSWFDAQLDVALVAMMVLLGWEKALGAPSELAWWEERVLSSAWLRGR